ncbi:CAP10 domain-containing protein [Mycena indigotica]|uniref:CAP10 domain-containing protein n=1 Tax=Mycena indigotica TaxID=2126181 RepID=A0A8H6S4F0_9AGAR|nr:CAP10 domain-containing protein [Mycena indigotica]KAF7292611.1 CAP10 domain-containing protein [Mycena indigotica]
MLIPLGHLPTGQVKALSGKHGVEHAHRLLQPADSILRLDLVRRVQLEPVTVLLRAITHGKLVCFGGGGGGSSPKREMGTASGTGTGSEFSFARETGSRTVDFCKNPGQRYEQSHFFSDWRTYPLLVPIFSPGRAQGFTDIRIPSHYYYGGTRRYTYAWDPINLEQRVTDPMEVPWEKKRDAVWWRGASTGGGSSPSGFGHGYQRHRFLRMSSVGHVPTTGADGDRTTAVTFEVSDKSAVENEKLESSSLSASASTSGAPTSSSVDKGFRTSRVPLARLNKEVMDVAFVKEVVRIAPEHRVGDSVELGVSWGYKYLLDLDGMGYSGRFMAFLASDSVPLKNTIYDEFFSGWIEPWLGSLYPPPDVLFGAPSVLDAAGLAKTPYYGAPPSGDWEDEEDEEIEPGDKQRRQYEVQRQMSVVDPGRSVATGEGDRRARRIARAGKQWKATMGRKIDMEVYVYRLAIEYARLWADDRDLMSYTGP